MSDLKVCLYTTHATYDNCENVILENYDNGELLFNGCKISVPQDG